MSIRSDLLKARFHLNMGRINGLVTLIFTDPLRPKGLFQSDGVRADILRAIVVFLHATFEDILRSHLPKQNRKLTISSGAMRVEILDAPENRGFTGRGYDGTAGWSMNMTETGLRQLEGAELAMMQRDSDFYRQIRVDHFYQRLTVSAKDRIAGREVYVVDAVPETGNPEKLYFDAETGLLSRRDVVYGKTPVQHYYEDYRDVDGIKLPFILRSEGPVRVITRLKEIKHNVPIEDARFKSPSN